MALRREGMMSTDKGIAAAGVNPHSCMHALGVAAFHHARAHMAFVSTLLACDNVVESASRSLSS